MYSRNKIATIDKVYIWTFIIAFALFIYYTFDSYYIQELSRYLDANLADNNESLKSYLRLIMIATSLLFFHRKNSIINLTFLGKTLFVFSIYILMSIVLQKNFTNLMYYISTYTISTLWIYIYLFFYTISLRYDIERYIAKCIIASAVLSAALFIKNYVLNNAIGHTDWHYIESYYLITLFPAIILLKNRPRYALMLLVIICAIISGKRTGFITSAAIIVLYTLMIGRNISKKIQTIFLGTIILFTLYFALNQFIGDKIDIIIERIANIKEDDGSGRGEMYSDMYKLITENKDINSFIFGKGYNEVINSKMSNGFSAHNEFIETAYDFGILGFLIFVTIFVAIIRLYNKTKGQTEKVAVFISLVIFFIFSLTSHTILVTTSIVFLCMTWGYFDAQYIIYKRNKNIKIIK